VRVKSDPALSSEFTDSSERSITDDEMVLLPSTGVSISTDEVLRDISLPPPLNGTRRGEMVINSHTGGKESITDDLPTSSASIDIAVVGAGRQASVASTTATTTDTAGR